MWRELSWPHFSTEPMTPLFFCFPTLDLNPGQSSHQDACLHAPGSARWWQRPGLLAFAEATLSFRVSHWEVRFPTALLLSSSLPRLGIFVVWHEVCLTFQVTQLLQFYSSFKRGEMPLEIFLNTKTIFFPLCMSVVRSSWPRESCPMRHSVRAT